LNHHMWLLIWGNAIALNFQQSSNQRGLELRKTK
jgi:hypothetical protein